MLADFNVIEQVFAKEDFELATVIDITSF